MQIVWLLSCCVSVVAVNSDDDDDEASARSYLSRHNPKQDVNEISKRGIGTYHSERGGVWAQKGPSSSGWDVGDTSMAECTMHTYFEPWVEDEVNYMHGKKFIFPIPFECTRMTSGSCSVAASASRHFPVVFVVAKKKNTSCFLSLAWYTQITPRPP